MDLTRRRECYARKPHNLNMQRAQPRSHRAIRWLVSLVVALSVLLTYHRDVHALPTPIPSALSPQDTVTLSGDLEMWRARAQAWYQHEDLIGRRKRMRAFSRPLKQPCYYCHTRSFKGYVESTYLISLQMMAISAEQDVTCADCHRGRRGLTELGAKSLVQWRYAQENHLDCRDCHTPKGRFKTLNKRGEEARAALIKEVQARGKRWSINDSVIQEWLHDLKATLATQSHTPKTHVAIPPPIPQKAP